MSRNRISMSNLVYSVFTSFFAVAGITIVGCTAVPTQTDSQWTKTQSSMEREPVTNPLLSKEDSFFRFHEMMLAQSNPDVLAVQIPGGAVEKIKEADEDDLADNYIRSYDGATRSRLTWFD